MYFILLIICYSILNMIYVAVLQPLRGHYWQGRYDQKIWLPQKRVYRIKKKIIILDFIPFEMHKFN